MKAALTRLVLTATIVIFLAFLAGATFPTGAAPMLGRTSVDGIWGFAPTTLAVTGSQTLTPAVSEYHFNNVSVLTLTLSITNARPGDRLRLASLVATETTVLTNNTSLTAAQAISNDDVLEFEFFGGAWVPVIIKNN